MVENLIKYANKSIKKKKTPHKKSLNFDRKQLRYQCMRRKSMQNVTGKEWNRDIDCVCYEANSTGVKRRKKEAYRRGRMEVIIQGRGRQGRKGCLCMHVGDEQGGRRIR